MRSEYSEVLSARGEYISELKSDLYKTYRIRVTTLVALFSYFGVLISLIFGGIERNDTTNGTEISESLIHLDKLVPQTLLTENSLHIYMIICVVYFGLLLFVLAWYSLKGTNETISLIQRCNELLRENTEAIAKLESRYPEAEPPIDRNYDLPYISATLRHEGRRIESKTSTMLDDTRAGGSAALGIVLLLLNILHNTPPLFLLLVAVATLNTSAILPRRNNYEIAFVVYSAIVFSSSLIILLSSLFV